MKVSEIANGSEVKIYAAISGHSVVIMTEAIFGVNVGLLYSVFGTIQCSDQEQT